MAAPTTPLPADPPNGDERETLERFIDYYRAVLVRKAEGITDEEAQRPACPPSDLTILGVVRHMADVERSWFRRGVAGEDAPPRFYGPAHPEGDHDGDFHPPPTATLDEAIAAFAEEVAAARAVQASVASLDALEAREHPEVRNLRWILVHMIEEYARHCGHLDLLRQAIDGTTGD
jgi:uncharacterized damage-inducible protein DinB